MKNGPISLIVIHCTASANGRPVSLETVTQWHKARGFATIGYHYLIDVDGHVSKGRPDDEMGAHAQGHNRGSIAISLVGGIGGADKLNPGRYTSAQWEALRLLVLEMQYRYPTAKIVGHRDLSPDLDGDGIVEPHEWIKLCPAFDVASWLRSGMEAPEGNLLAVGKGASA